MAMKFIEKEWTNYLMTVMSKDSEIVQVIATRAAFYAGAGCVFFGLIDQISKTKDLDEVTTSDMKLMSEINAELDAFLKEIHDA